VHHSWALSPTRADLGVIATTAALQQAKLDPALIDDCIFGAPPIDPPALKRRKGGASLALKRRKGGASPALERRKGGEAGQALPRTHRRLHLRCPPCSRPTDPPALKGRKAGASLVSMQAHRM